ncbi:MAG: hypothetical protein M0Z71_16615 [Nitrospiraceae bacterium]|nr:hypothetical protein [Nitrospiraceae bacterium]
MGIRALGESIILQSLEDLGSATYRKESILFFSGEGFRLSAKIAGLDVPDIEKIMALSKLISPPETHGLSRRARAAGGAQ